MRKLKTFLCCHFNHRKHLLTSFLASSLSLDDIWKWNKKDNFEEQPTLQTHTANIRLNEYSQMYGSLNLLYDCNSKVNFFEGSMFFKLKDLNLCRYKLSQMRGKIIHEKNYPFYKICYMIWTVEKCQRTLLGHHFVTCHWVHSRMVYFVWARQQVMNGAA